MSLINFDNDSDTWLSEYEVCERLYREITGQLNRRDILPKTSENYASISATIRIKMKQSKTEVDQLKSKLDNCFSLTFEEKERRLRLIENLESKNVQLLSRFTERSGQYAADRSQLLGESSSGWNTEEDEVRKPLLIDQDREYSVDELREQQNWVLKKQDDGLENLSKVISRNKNIAITLNTAVNQQSDMIDDIAERMDRTNVSVQRETTQVTFVSAKDSTWGYWLVILLLFVAIVTVLLV